MSTFPEYLDRFLLRNSPPRLTALARRKVLTSLGASIHPSVILGQGVRVIGYEGLNLASGVSVARDVTLDARGGLHLMKDALIGFESILLTSTHISSDPTVPVQAQGMYSLPITLEPRAWLGTRVTVLPGVTIGEAAIVGAGAVVTRNIEPYTIYAGIPARKIGIRNTK